MIKGKLFQGGKLTISNILKLITPFDIYRYYLGLAGVNVFRINRAISSPYHKDDNPSFLLSDRGGSLHHIDFTDTSKKGDCFQFVQDLYNIDNLPNTLLMIDRDFGLGLAERGGNVGAYKMITKGYDQPEMEESTTPNLIQVVTRKFNRDELAYWNHFYQDVADLKAENIFAPKKIYLNKKLYTIPLNEIAFAYLYEGDYVKIYRPFAPTKKEKWLSNVPLNLSWGHQNLKKDKNSLITKSHKDYMVCRKVYPHIVGIQNESIAAFSEELPSLLLNNSKKVFYGGDSDEPGKKASIEITNTFGFSHINPPDYLLQDNCNDWAQWAAIEGLWSVEEHFKNKGLLE